MVVLYSYNSLVVVQPVAKEGEDFLKGSNVKGSGLDIEERIMGDRVEKNCETREEFEERIVEIDMELNKFENGNTSGSGFDKDSNLEEDASTNHVTQLDFN